MSVKRKKVLLPNILGDAGKRLLADRQDIECIEFPNTISKEDFRALLVAHAPIHGVILGLTPFGKNELQVAHELKVVSRIGVGFDAVDVAALTEADIPVMVCANANHRAVAEHTIGFMLALVKRFTDLTSLVNEGRWHQRYEYLPGELEGREVLVVGHGRIGKRVTELCLALNMQVSVYDPYLRPGDLPANVRFRESLDDALPSADWVTLHCPKNEETIGMFSEYRLSLLKPSAFLINTARGGIVDELALSRLLIGRHIAGAALDVFSPEPPSADSPLIGLQNVLYSPHLAGVSREAVSRMAILAAGNVIDVFDSVANLDYAINPQVFNKSFAI
ncbi:NAD(P)-dependent oxidoreductase [Xanthomonas axonopodis]|uniref:NAD(P)-dependent oxidoreductase n=1 Tax=Xanthomonas axonopodis TaxID=53413 RepID=UPI000996CC91|nr:NAD(P)-dependent oxidoreductase [Xanthomonas axonopodis]